MKRINLRTMADRAASPRAVGAIKGFGALAALAILASCTQVQSDRTATGLYRLMGSQRNPSVETLENVVQYSVVETSRAMVNVPSAVVVFERNLNGAVEQRIVLPNDTAVRGDNVIHVRAQTSDSAQLQRLNFDDLRERFGGLPAPFERLNDNALSSSSDALGSYVFARENVGTQTVCVLVLRRLGVGSRPLPRGTQAIDVVMRNCANGTLEQALAPMSQQTLGVAGTVSGTNLSLSPHAAPRS